MVKKIIVLEPSWQVLEVDDPPSALPNPAQKLLGALDGVVSSVGHGREVDILAHVVSDGLEVLETVAKPGAEEAHALHLGRRRNDHLNFDFRLFEDLVDIFGARGTWWRKTRTHSIPKFGTQN